jgi:hypothetical protein
VGGGFGGVIEVEIHVGEYLPELELFLRSEVGLKLVLVSIGSVTPLLRLEVEHLLLILALFVRKSSLSTAGSGTSQ